MIRTTYKDINRSKNDRVNAMSIANAGWNTYQSGKDHPDQQTGHILAHALLGAAVAAAGGNDPLTAGLAAGGAEAAAPLLAQWLYGKNASELDANEKNIISSIVGLAGAGIGATTGNVANAVTGGMLGQNAVENNFWLNKNESDALVDAMSECKGGDDVACGKEKEFYALLNKRRDEYYETCQDATSQGCTDLWQEINQAFFKNAEDYKSAYDGYKLSLQYPDTADYYKAIKQENELIYGPSNGSGDRLEIRGEAGSGENSAHSGSGIDSFYATNSNASSYAYGSTPGAAGDWWNDYSVFNRAIGTIQVVSGVMELGVAYAAAPLCASVIGCAIPVYLMGTASDNILAGAKTAWTGELHDTYLNQGFQLFGLSRETATWLEVGMGVGSSAAAAKGMASLPKWATSTTTTWEVVEVGATARGGARQFSGGAPSLEGSVYNADIVNARSADFYRLYGDSPLRGTMSSVEARQWYLAQDAQILNRIDSSASLERQAHQAFDLRNVNRTQAREFMSDRVTADRLIREEPNMTWNQMLEYRRSQGLTGDDAYRSILRSSQKTRAEVNRRLGVE